LKPEAGNRKPETGKLKPEAGLPAVALAKEGNLSLENASSFKSQPSGFLVSPGDTAALAEAMEVLVENPELRRVMGEAGRKRCLENFTREIYMERIGAVLGGARPET